MQNVVIRTNKWFFRNFMGLFAIVNNVINTILYLKETNQDKDSNLYVELVKNSAYYYEGITDTDNVWEYYFYQPCEINFSAIDASIHTQLSPVYKQDNFVVRLHRNDSDAVKNDLRYINRCIFFDSKNTIKLKPVVEEKIQYTKRKLGLDTSKYIAVHFRYFKVENPNHFGDGHIGKRPEFQIWFNQIDKVIKDGHKIFLATDDDLSLNAFIERYGDRVVYTENVDRTFTRDIENCGFNPVGASEEEMQNFVSKIIYSDRKKNPYEIGMDAIVDAYILSGGDVLIRQCSGLSFFSMIVNPEIDVINIDTI